MDTGDTFGDWIFVSEGREVVTLALAQPRIRLGTWWTKPMIFVRWWQREMLNTGIGSMKDEVMSIEEYDAQVTEAQFQEAGC